MSPIQNLLVIDSQVTNWQALTAAATPDTVVLILDPATDGLTQISAYLSSLIAASTQTFTPLQSIQIISHGSAGSISLGSMSITTSNLKQYTSQLATIGSALTATGDILLYGCNVAAEQIGLDFINQFAALSRADVAASTDLTGATALGGNWVLEAATGAIEATAIQPIYNGLLFVNVAPTNQPSVGSGLGSLLEEHKFAITASSLLGSNSVSMSVTALSLVDASQGILTGNVIDGWTFLPAVNVTGNVLFSYSVADGVSTNTATANLFINAINDAPSGSNGTITILEDSSYIVSVADFGFTDIQDTPANSFVTVKISSISNGTLQLDGVIVSSSQSVSVSDIRAGKLIFTPSLNGNGSQYASFGFRVQDDGGTTNGGFDISPVTNNLTFNVTPVNDAPTTQVIYLGTTLENHSISIASTKILLGVSDVDFDRLILTDLSLADPSQGTLSGDASLGWIFTTAISFKGNVNFNYTVSDGVLSSSNTAALLINAFVGDGSVPFYSEGLFSVDDGSDIAYNPSALTVLDINGDGRTDIVSLNLGSSTISVFTNNGVGSFNTPVVYSTNNYSGYFGGVNPQNTIVTSDINGDGKTDLVVSNYADNTLSVFINNGIGGFESSYLLQGTGASVVLADINKDGKVDILTGGYAGLSVLLNNGGGVFTSQAINIIYPVNSFALADINNDGSVDIVSVNTSNKVTVKTNDGNGGFDLGNQIDLGLVGFSRFSSHEIVLGDVNGDGFIDIVTANTGRNNVSILTNNGNGGFNAAIVLSIGVGAYNTPSSIVLADINGDDAVDIITTNPGSGNISVLSNTGTGDFNTAKVLSVSAWNVSGLTVGDVNGNGKLDIITANPNYNTITVLSPVVTQAPEGIDGSISTDTTYIFKVSDFGFTDVNNNVLLAVKIASLPTTGLLVYDGRAITDTDISTGYTIAPADITAGKLTYQPATNTTSQYVTNIGFQVIDNGSTAFNGVNLDPTPNIVTVNVAPNAAQLINIPPTLTKFDSFIVKGLEHTPTTITFNNLISHSDATDVDGTVIAFNIKSVESGTLSIGTDLASAIAWNTNSNVTVDVTHLAFWTSDVRANGKVNAFTAVAKDNGSLVSSTPVQAKVHVRHKVNETSGSDKLLGTSVDDSFNISSGQDTLTGGTGSDDFTISSTNVVIKDLGLGGDLLHVSNGASVNAILSDQFIAGSDSNNDGLATITDNGNFNVDLHLASGANGFTVNAAKSMSGVSLIGGLHSDTIIGGKGNDTLDGGADNDSIFGGAGNDSLLGGLGDDILSAGRGDDTLSGGAGNNTLTGGAGLDTFIIDTAGTDTVSDLSQNDVLKITANAHVTANSARAWTATAEDINNGSLIVNALNNVDLSLMTGAGTVVVNYVGTKAVKLIGGNQSTILIGGIGKDSLTAATGDTTLSGGASDDTYFINSANVSIIEGTDVGTKGDLVKSSVNYSLSANVENLTLIGFTAHLATGNDLNNVLTANNFNATLDGGLGNDTMIGGAGNDTFVVNNVADIVVDKLGGTDTVISSVSYLLGQTIENLMLTGTATINGAGNRLSNVISGNDGINTLLGLAGNDIIDGGNGNDIIRGGAGNDNLTGGAGADTFWSDTQTNATTNLDTITDFVSGTDKLQFSVSVLTALGVVGQFAEGDQRFWSSATGLAHDATDRLIYNTVTGVLSYDRNGNVAGGEVIIEVLGTATTHPALTAIDMWVA